MKASQYTALTEGLKGLTLEIKYHSMADPSEFRAVYDTMLECRDDFVEENQGRHDRKVGISPDGQRLFDAMGRFLNAIETPIGKGDSFLCFEVCRMCQDWRGRMVEWFPGIDTAPGIIGDTFVARLKSSDAYNNAIKDGTITAPFTWNGTITELADWLLNNDFILDHSHGMTPTRKWSWADSVFSLPDGSKVTRIQLKNAFHH